MKMRRSRVLEKLRAGQVASSTKLNLGDPRAAEIAAASGVDCVWLDLEHVPTDLREVESQIRACKVFDADALVRVRRGSYSDLVVPLEMDATGIMVPHVMSAEDARRVVWQTRFHPVGRRPIDGGNADGFYCRIPAAEYIRQANAERFLMIQIEDPEPMAELDAICQIEGIDVVFFGPGDYSHALGLLGKPNPPEVADARRRVAEACRRHGKIAGTVATPENLAEMVDLGYRFLNIGADVLALTDYFGRVAKTFADEATRRRP